MFFVEKRYLLKMEAAGGPGGDVMTIPWISEEAVQYLCVWLYTPGQASLGAGTAVVRRNGTAVGAATAFAGNVIIIPADILVIGADFELQLPHPANGKALPVISLFRFDATAIAVVEDKPPLPNAQLLAPPPITTDVVVTNTDPS